MPSYPPPLVFTRRQLSALTMAMPRPASLITLLFCSICLEPKKRLLLAASTRAAECMSEVYHNLNCSRAVPSPGALRCRLWRFSALSRLSSLGSSK